MVDTSYYGSPQRRHVHQQRRTATASVGAIYYSDEAALATTTTRRRDPARFSVSSSYASSQSSGLDTIDSIEAMGEVFIWGEGAGEQGILGGASTTVLASPPTQASIGMDVLLPRLLNSPVDVQAIACGVGHAVLLSRQGQAFSWGEECGGRLGHGVDAAVGQPQRLDSLANSLLGSLCCGEYHTCAVTRSGELYTWGDGTHNFGLLGHSKSCISHWKPKQVSSLEGVSVASVACGPWHTVFVSTTGQLYSFGDGTFGVLGHGDKQSVATPREVESLRGLKVIRAACGPWHTAAVVEVTASMGVNNNSSSSSGIANTNNNVLSSGKLFTWGDGDKHRLGHGDKEQKLVPTCVAALVDFNFRLVACGHSLTVAVTTQGQLFTMGSAAYGQLGDPHSTGRLPCLVKLGKAYVDEIACGAYHVVALTSKMGVFTWGKGANGRLGHGDVKDRNVPTFVEALRDKQVKKVACGSGFTAAVCLRKPVVATKADVSACSGCKQAFGFTRKKHSCYHCGHAYCHWCSSKKAYNAALAPSLRKPARVCDACFVKLAKMSETKDLWTDVDTPRLPKSSRRSKRPDSLSRVSPAPTGLLSWASVNAPSTFSSVGPEMISKSVPVSRVGSRATSPLSRRPSSPGSTTPLRTLTASRDPVEEVKRRNETLNFEISRLTAEVEKLSRKCELQEKELLDSSKRVQDAFTVACAESAKCKAAKEVIMSLTAQLKELADGLPPGLYRQAIQGVHLFSEESQAEEEEDSLVVRNKPGNIACEVPARLSDVDVCRPPRTSSNAQEWVEQDQPGVYITLRALPGGTTRDLKRVRFSRRRFSEKQAELWWQANRQRVYKQYDIREHLKVPPMQ